jgi:hypothetical protein
MEILWTRKPSVWHRILIEQGVVFIAGVMGVAFLQILILELTGIKIPQLSFKQFLAYVFIPMALALLGVYLLHRFHDRKIRHVYAHFSTGQADTTMPLRLKILLRECSSDARSFDEVDSRNSALLQAFTNLWNEQFGALPIIALRDGLRKDVKIVNDQLQTRISCTLQPLGDNGVASHRMKFLFVLSMSSLMGMGLLYVYIGWVAVVIPFVFILYIVRVQNRASRKFPALIENGCVISDIGDFLARDSTLCINERQKYEGKKMCLVGHVLTCTGQGPLNIFIDTHKKIPDLIAAWVNDPDALQ